MASYRSRIWYVLLALPILLALACIPFGLGGLGGDSATQGPVESFTAEVTSPVSVLVQWPAASGATKYIVEVKYGDTDFFPLAEVAGDQTSFEDFPAPDDMDLTYRLQVVTASGVSDAGTISVTTPKQEPNPLTVQAHDYEPVPWTPPTVDPLDPNFDPTTLYPPGFDPNNPDDFDPSSMMSIPSATEIIGPEGGTISITSPDDVTFTLTLPEGALDAEIPITLIPVESIDGLPLSGGLLGAVRIEPEGLLLEIPALLQINLPDGQAIPDGNKMYGFAFYEDGKEFHLHPFASQEWGLGLGPGSGRLASPSARPLAGELAGLGITMLQPHGTGAGTQSDARSVVQDHRPTRNRDAAASHNAAAQAGDDDDLAPLPILPSTKSANSAFQSARDASTWQEAMEALDKFETHIQQYGDKGIKHINDKVWDTLLDKLNKLLQENKGKCVTSADFNVQAFAQRLLNPPKGSFAEQMAERFKNKFGDQILKDIAEITKNCRYTLKIDSTIQAVFQTGNGEVAYTLPVQGDVRLKFVSIGETPYLTGTGSLTYGTVLVDATDSRCDPIKYDHPNKAYVLIILEPVFEAGRLKDYFIPGLVVVDAPGAKFHTICYDKKGNPVGRLQLPMMKSKSAWLGFYTAAHVPDVEIKEWEIRDTSIVGHNQIVAASKTYDRDFTPTGGWGKWTERSFFTLLVRKIQ